MRNLDRLRCFVTVADHGQVKRASDTLGYSPSVVSQRVKQLEQGWGVVLFDRTGGRLRLTDVGTRLLVPARRVVNEVDNLDRAARAAAGGVGTTVRVAYRHNAAAWVSRLARLLAADGADPAGAPGITVRPMAREHHDVVEAVLSRDADIGIAGPADGLASMELSRVPLGCLAVPRRHRLATAPTVTVRDLHGEPYLIDDRDQHSLPRREITGFLRSHGVRPDYRPSRLTSAQDLLTLVGAEAGVALVRSSVKAPPSPEGARPAVDGPDGRDDVVFRTVSGDVPLILDMLLWDPDHAPAIARRCVEALKGHAGSPL